LFDFFFSDLKISIFLHFLCKKIDICFFTFFSFDTIICADKCIYFVKKSTQAVFKLEVTQKYSKLTQVRKLVKDKITSKKSLGAHKNPFKNIQTTIKAKLM